MIAAEAATNQQSPLNIKIITCYLKKLARIIKKNLPKIP